MAASGKIHFISNHSMHCVGPMTGMITRSMPLWVVRNKTFGNYAYSTFNEGIGKVMRFGANSTEVIDRLRWIQNDLGPAMKRALQESGPISLKLIISRALAMGDEMHQRNVAASSLLTRELAPYLANVVEDPAKRFKILSFLSTNDQFFLNLAMAAGKATMDPVRDIPHCSVVTAMSRNGTNFGSRRPPVCRSASISPVIPKRMPTPIWATVPSVRPLESVALPWHPLPRWCALSAPEISAAP